MVRSYGPALLLPALAFLLFTVGDGRCAVAQAGVTQVYSTPRAASWMRPLNQPGTAFTRLALAPPPAAITRVINPPEWSVTNTATNTAFSVAVEPRGSIVSYESTAIVTVYAYTNASGLVAVWVDLHVYPTGLTVTDRRRRVLIADVVPEGAGPCFHVADYDGKFMLVTRRDGAGDTLLLYRVKRRGFKLLGERPVDILSQPFLAGGKVVTTPTTLDLSTDTETSAIECYNRRLNKQVWSRPPAPGTFMPVDVAGRFVSAFPNGVACCANVNGGLLSWVLSKKSRLLSMQTSSIAADQTARLVPEPRGGVLLWMNSGTVYYPTNTPVIYVGRRDVRPMTFPGLGNVNWNSVACDGKYFVTATRGPAITLQSFSMRGTPRLKGQAALAEYPTVSLDGSQLYAVTTTGGNDGAQVFNASLTKEKWNVPHAEGALRYIGRRTFLRIRINAVGPTTYFTYTFITRRGTLAEHTFTQ